MAHPQMSSPIASSELIINERGAVYHLDLRPEELADTVITVGDPDRVERVSRHFDEVEFRGRHREFVTHTGFFRGKRITVLSSGIGPDNIDIVMNELDALVNIDLPTRTIKPMLRSLDIIRVGTCGSLQADIPVDSFVASTHGLGIDNLLHFYRPEHNEEERQILHAFVTQTQLHNHLSRPYISMGSPGLLKRFTDGFFHGVTVTCPGFYGPQGRVLRLGLAHPTLNQMLTDFSFGHHRITNFEMETSAIYGLGKLLGHHTLSLNAVVANRVSRSFSSDGQAAVDQLILRALERLSAAD
ncbi:MAG: nucleoside phosphorylase [Chitinophagaceae bacterium]|jgi:uridine phosphorylase|nr:nucleoside phosphorylase [Chitinophagaceae bacterium]